METHSVVLEEGGVKLSLTVVDTPGFGDKVSRVAMKKMTLTMVVVLMMLLMLVISKMILTMLMMHFLLI